MWNNTPVSTRLGITYPIVQGPFGGGPSSVRLAAAVSNAGGLGSYGMQSLEPGQMAHIVQEIRSATKMPFAVNLWISQAGEFEPDNSGAYEAAMDFLAPYYREVGLDAPARPERFIPKIEDQLAAILELRPPVFSFVFGIPSADMLNACRSLGILTMGTATTAEEARALENAGVDCIVASGFEAGGHKGSFLGTAHDSMTGTFALIPQIADSVKTPFIAAGGIADARGIAAALALGAQGVQIGTAFLACDESDAHPLHREKLFAPGPRRTTLTQAFTGRLARTLTNRFAQQAADSDARIAPYPVQAWSVGKLKQAAVEQNRSDLISLSAGQAVPLVHHRSAVDLMDELVRETPRLLERLFRPT